MRKVNIVKNRITGKNHIYFKNRVLCGYKPYEFEKPEKLDIVYVTCATCMRIYGFKDILSTLFIS
jgi:hypothetical protein